MKIHEYQAKEIFSRYSIPVTNETVCYTPDEVVAAATKFGLPVVVKAQVHAGGRGKAGGVKLARTMDEVRDAANKILGMDIKGYTVEKVLVAEGIQFNSEFYVGLTIDRNTKSVIFMASAEGGVEIEEVAKDNPDAIHKFVIEPDLGMTDFLARKIAFKLFNDMALVKQAVNLFRKLYQIFVDTDASLVEINPLVITNTGVLLALDGRYFNLIDKDKTTKYLASYRKTFWAEYQSARPAKLFAYSVSAANDAPNRDPKSWTLYGSNNNSSWIAIDKQENIDFNSIDYPEILGISMQLVKIDSLLLINDFHGDTLINVFNLNSGKIVKRLIPKGSGPGELISPLDIQLCDSNLYVLCRPKFSLNHGSVDSVTAGSFVISNDGLLPQKSDRFIPLTENQFVFSGLWNKRYILYNPSKASEIKEFGDYPNYWEGEKDFPENAKAMFHQSRFIKHPSKPFFTNPISGFFLLAAFISIILTIRKERNQKRSEKNN
jgi:hypothetical protein